MNEQIPHIYEFDEFRLDAAKRLLWRGGETVPLMPKAFDVLLMLVRQHGQVVKKDDLLTRVWHDTVVEENSLNVNVSVLRKIFGEKPNEHRFIVTVPGIGYQFVADVKETNENLANKPKEYELNGDKKTVSAETLSPENVTEVSRPLSKNSRFAIISFVGLALIVLSFGAYFLLKSKEIVPSPTNAREVKSIAVLPFKSIGSDETDKYLGGCNSKWDFWDRSQFYFVRLNYLTKFWFLARENGR